MKTRRSIESVLLVAAGLTLIVPEVASAQQETCRPLGQLGIARLECGSCEVRFEDDGEAWSFGTEPTVGRVHEGSPASGVIRAGDRIVSIDGRLITTREGGRLLGSVGPRQAVRLEIRRDDRVFGVSYVTDELCGASESTESGGDGERATGAAPAGVTEATSRAVEAAGRAESDRPDASGASVELSSLRLLGLLSTLRNTLPVPGPLAALRESPVSLGFGIQCGDCFVARNTEEDGPRWIWRFGEDGLRVKSVAPGSPAEEGGLRADDQLLSIDGQLLSSREGQLRFSALSADDEVRWGISRGGRAMTVRFAPTGEGREGRGVPRADVSEADVLRFGGTIGEARVEVRGPPDVLIEMDAGSEWVVIRLGEYEVRVMNRPRR